MSVENPVELFDLSPREGRLDPKTVKQLFDGTVFNGTQGVRVFLDKNGDLLRYIQIQSFNLNHYNFYSGEAGFFQRGKSGGGWVGEGGFYGDTTVLGKRLNAVVESTKKDWDLWKAETDEITKKLSFRNWKRNKVKFLQALEAGENPDLDPTILTQVRGRLIEESDSYLISPTDINISKHLFDAFGNTETEVAAYWIIKYCQEKNGWAPFTRNDISDLYNKTVAKDKFTPTSNVYFYQLINPERGFSIISGSHYTGGGWVVEDEKGICKVTTAFVEAAYKSSQNNIHQG